MQSKLVQRLLLSTFGVILLLYSCANIHSLNGGLKDTFAPQDSIYSPLNFNVNFSEQEFSIEFDEYIKLNDISNQLIVSPPLNQKPKVVVKKKTLFVSFEDTLVPNTTYTFNFGEAVVDFTEGNAAKNLSYVFSTGPELDSLSVVGKCIDVYTNTPMEGVKVMLYNEDIDSLPMTEKPFYFGTTDKSGNFDIKYLKPGNYKLFCLKDENNNYLYDEGEYMGFIDSLVTSQINDSIQKQQSVLMSKAYPEKQTLLDYTSDSTGFVAMSFAKKTTDLSFEIIDLLNPEFKMEERKDSTYFWITSSGIKNQVFKLVVKDNFEILDTLFVLYYPEEKSKIDWIKTPGNHTISNDSNFVFETNHTLIQDLDLSLFSLFEDSIEKTMSVNIDEKTERKILVDSDPIAIGFKEAKTYKLTVLPGGITSINGVQNDTLNLKFKTNSKSSYGKITVNFVFENPSNYLVQLIDDKENIYFQSSISEDGLISVSQLLAKKYTLRLIEDNNTNKLWDPGNYFSKIQPEKILYFPETIEVKPNWELEYSWKVK